MQDLPLLHHTDDCESCRKAGELRLVTLFIDGLQLLFALVAVVVLAYAIFRWITGGWA